MPVPVFPRVVPGLVPVFPCPIAVEFPDRPIGEEWVVVEGREAGVEGRLEEGLGALTCGAGADFGADGVFLC